MNASVLTPGTRVCFDDDSSKFGVIIENYAKRAEYPGFVPVRWDNGDRTMSRAVRLIPIDSRSATPQADRGQTAGTPTSPQGVPAPMTEGNAVNVTAVKGHLARVKAKVADIELTLAMCEHKGKFETGDLRDVYAQANGIEVSAEEIRKWMDAAWQEAGGEEL